MGNLSNYSFAMPASYAIDCPVARTLDLIGERWTILILRDLFLHGPRRYHDFQESFPHLSPTTLANRLKKLEENGIVAREVYQDTPPRARYVLTPRGLSLGPVMLALRAWGSQNTDAAP